jgi:hypothetical protein
MKIIDCISATEPLRPAGAWRQRRTRRLSPLRGVVVAAALLAGCGGSSSAGSRTHLSGNSLGGSVARIDSTTTSNGATKPNTKPNTKPSPLGFAKCMRAHGVPNFPDPNTLGRIPITSSGGMTRAPSGGFTANPNSPAYETASNDCRSLAVATPVSQAPGDQMIASQLKFAVCMRAHGVPNYPDPTSNGEVGNNGAISGVNPSSPAVQSAEKTCSKVLVRPSGLPGG